MKHEKHYDEEYFAYQNPIGQFGGKANLVKFRGFIRETDTIVEFGSGGGYLLNNITCKEKIGIEINPAARQRAEALGVKSVESAKFIPDAHADLIISNNALEHTTHPLDELKEMYRILKPGGRIVFVVPCESIHYKYKPNDINYHLYSWSPMCIGNLFTEAGFQVIESKAFWYKWPPHFQKVAGLFGWTIFDLICKLYARWETSWYHVRVVAEK